MHPPDTGDRDERASRAVVLRVGDDCIWDAVRLGVLNSADLNARGKIDTRLAPSPVKKLPYQLQERPHVHAPPPPPPTQLAGGKGGSEVALESVLRELREMERENHVLRRNSARQGCLIRALCDYIQ